MVIQKTCVHCTSAWSSLETRNCFAGRSLDIFIVALYYFVMDYSGIILMAGGYYILLGILCGGKELVNILYKSSDLLIPL
jgi:hypothetical protein